MRFFGIQFNFFTKKPAFTTFSPLKYSQKFIIKIRLVDVGHWNETSVFYFSKLNHIKINCMQSRRSIDMLVTMLKALVEINLNTFYK